MNELNVDKFPLLVRVLLYKHLLGLCYSVKADVLFLFTPWWLGPSPPSLRTLGACLSHEASLPSDLNSKTGHPARDTKRSASESRSHQGDRQSCVPSSGYVIEVVQLVQC